GVGRGGRGGAGAPWRGVGRGGGGGGLWGGRVGAVRVCAPAPADAPAEPGAQQQGREMRTGCAPPAAQQCGPPISPADEAKEPVGDLDEPDGDRATLPLVSVECGSAQMSLPYVGE